MPDPDATKFREVTVRDGGDPPSAAKGAYGKVTREGVKHLKTKSAGKVDREVADPIRFSIDIFAVFDHRLWLSGWLVGAKPIAALEFRSLGVAGGRHVIASFGTISSPDVAEHHGPGAATSRFMEQIAIEPSDQALADAHLAVLYADGEIAGIGNLAATDTAASAASLTERFSATITSRPAGRLLEVGSRARSGIVRRDLVPPGWGYTGLDVMAGPNVDVVGDAHELASIFRKERFDAVMAFSVLEHLLMPWKFVVELNRVLNTGAIGLFTTHQCWPLHDQPWDFWRFSDRAWDGLFNKATGFEVIEARMGEPAFVVAQRCHAVTNFGMSQGGFLASNVMFRKIGNTKLSWPVALGDTIATSYPQS